VIFGEHDTNTLAQLADVAGRAEHVALMADGHMGYTMPIGGVAAYDNKVSVVGVGFDIACGNAAIKTNLTLRDIAGAPERKQDSACLNAIADEIYDVISFGMGGTNPLADEAAWTPRPASGRWVNASHLLYMDPRWYIIDDRHFRDNLQAKARKQLGTVGGGNHYVDVFADEAGAIWVGVHFGSRGLGHTIASSFLAIAQGGTWGDRGKEAEALLDLDTQMGDDYWNLMEMAGDYAYAGREWVARKVVELIGGQEVEMVHNHHNFAWREEHFGESLIVVRKGSTPAFPGQRGFVGGSMGDNSVILEGTLNQNEETRDRQIDAMFSTVHGAGRVMGRMAAKGKWKRGELVRPGLISSEDMDGWMDKADVVLRGGDLDEAPQAYRRLDDVLAAQGDTINVLHTLTPLIVCMAPRRTGRSRR
jgi:tRNA-splicing ligase RtcB